MSESDRAAYTARVARAKKIAAEIARLLNSPSGLIVPDPLKAALGEWAILVVELAQLSHAQFDMAPFDLGELTRRVDKLDGLTGGKIDG